MLVVGKHFGDKHNEFLRLRNTLVVTLAKLGEHRRSETLFGELYDDLPGVVTSSAETRLSQSLRPKKSLTIFCNRAAILYIRK
jgi:hypothetical protein